MKKIVLILIAIVQMQAVAQEDSVTTQIKAVENPTEVSPQMITGFHDKSLSTYVSVVSTLIGGAWLSQQVTVNLGYQEEAVQSFEFQIMGEVENVRINQLAGSNGIEVVVTSSTGPWSETNASFGPGFTEYKMTVLPQKGTDTGYAAQATLVQTVFSEDGL
jgi:hypothetical protein